MPDLSDEDSSQLIVKHLMDVNQSDSESRLLYAAADNVKKNNILLRNSILRTGIFVTLGVAGVCAPPAIGIGLAIVAGISYFVYDYKRSKHLNKQMEKMVDLSSDIDEKRHVLKELNRQLQDQNTLLNDKVNIISQFETIKEEKHRVQNNLANITSYNNHLTNVIRGVNHEVSPWLGSIANIASIAKEEVAGKIESGKMDSTDLELVKYLDEIKKAARQAADVLVFTSKNIKKLRNWSINKSNLMDTINSWGYIALMEHDIKGRLSKSNLNIDYKSLNFEAIHSPMLVSQIVLNLVKNSIDHNESLLDDYLVVKIYGNGEDTLYVEDNGKGIPTKIINDIFKVGVSTKKESGLPSGLGLSTTLDYCVLMGSKIRVESKVGKYTRFHIVFRTDKTDTQRLNKNEDNDRRSAYYQVITQPSNDPELEKGTDVPFNTPIVPVPEPYKKYPSSAAIEVIPNPDTKFRMRMVDIDETLKKLN